ncbi:MAG: D-2-hydroxyacid dehydrogenase [Lachnospiraceae bacterium]
MSRRIFISEMNFNQDLKARLCKGAVDCGFEIEFAKKQGDLPADPAEVEIILGNTAGPVRAAENLKWVCLTSAGLDGFLQTGAMDGREDQVILSNSSGAYGVSIAEHMVMVTLMMLRCMLEFTAEMEGHVWAPKRAQKSIKDARVTVLGAGDIGTAYAERVRAFGPARITAVNRSGLQKNPVYDQVIRIADLHQVLPETDILAMSLPGTPETNGVIGREELNLMPEGSYLINVGRGNAIDEAALCQALESGRLSGAALDVMATEPLPADDPLWDAKNILLTPHVSGKMTLPYTCRMIADMFLDDLVRYTEGRPLLHQVDPRRGY